MSDQSETSPLTFESLQSALVEARDIYYSRVEPETETLRPAKERLLRALGYDLSTIPRDTHIVLTTSPFGRDFIEVDTGTGDPGRHYLSELTDPQDAALRDLIEQARS